MSTAEPFMPAHEPAAPTAGAEHDVDHDTDVIFDGDADDTAEEAEGGEDPTPDYPLSAAFRTPVAGERLTAEQLERDLENE